MFFSDRDDVQEILESLFSAGVLDQYGELSGPDDNHAPAKSRAKRQLPAFFPGNEAQATQLAAEIAAEHAQVFGWAYGPHVLANPETVNAVHWQLDGIAVYTKNEYLEKKFGRPDLCDYGNGQVFVYRTPGFGGQSELSKLEDFVVRACADPNVVYVDLAYDCPWSLQYEYVAKELNYRFEPDGMLVAKNTMAKMYAYDKARTLWAGGVFEGPVFQHHSRPVEYMASAQNDYYWQGWTRLECRVSSGGSKHTRAILGEFHEFWASLLPVAVAIPMWRAYEAAYASITETVAVLVKFDLGWVLVHAYGRRDIPAKKPNVCTGRVMVGGYTECLAWATTTRLAGRPVKLLASGMEDTTITAGLREWKPTLTDSYRSNNKNTTSRAKWVACVPNFNKCRDFAYVFEFSLDKRFPVFSTELAIERADQKRVEKPKQTFAYEAYLATFPDSIKQTAKWKDVSKTAVVLAKSEKYLCINGAWTRDIPEEILSAHENGQVTILVNRQVATLAELQKVGGKKAADLLATYGDFLR